MTGQQREPPWLDYQPSARGYDLELFSFASLRGRVPLALLRGAHRYAFHLLICVTEGTVSQLVDFEPVECRPGSLLVLRPGQVHSFGAIEDWDGWLLLFRPEFLPAAGSATAPAADLGPLLALNELPDHLALEPPDLAAFTEALSRMQQDVARGGPAGRLQALLRHQACALILRLMLLQERSTHAQTWANGSGRLYAAFRKLLDQNLARWHRVSDYANALGCTEKSLTRAARAATGRHAKDVISARLSLEAKRLLAHTNLPVYLIGSTLGFDEATNFSKFFRREAGTAPAMFRSRAQAANKTDS